MYRRVADYIHAGRQDPLVMRADAPHAYSADDAEFAVAQPGFRINGVVVRCLRLPRRFMVRR
jgi:hypothetical protein